MIEALTLTLTLNSGPFVADPQTFSFGMGIFRLTWGLKVLWGQWDPLACEFDWATTMTWSRQYDLTIMDLEIIIQQSRTNALQ